MAIKIEEKIMKNKFENEKQISDANFQYIINNLFEELRKIEHGIKFDRDVKQKIMLDVVMRTGVYLLLFVKRHLMEKDFESFFNVVAEALKAKNLE